MDAVPRFPPHACGMTIDHNPHSNLYESAGDYIERYKDLYEFASPEDLARCVESGELWTMQWYPDTPIGFLAVAAPTFAELIAFANSGIPTK